MDILKLLETEFQVQPTQLKNTIQLLEEGNTIPFIARYRKEVTGSMDDQVLRTLYERLNYLKGLEKRKEEVSNSIISQEKMTQELQQAIEEAKTLTEVEDLYRPYKQKRKTRASVAKEHGLEPLAEWLLQPKHVNSPEQEAENYLNEQVPTVQDAIREAMDIIAEKMSDHPELRKKLRAYLIRTGLVKTKATNEETESVYQMYYDYQEPVHKIAEHRILAIDRGEREGYLKVSIEVDINYCIAQIASCLVSAKHDLFEMIQEIAKDAYQRLIFPSLEREVRNLLTERASKQAIGVFSANLQKLLMQPPVKNAVTMGFDPGYRHGCKIAVVDGIGKVLDTAIIYPRFDQKDEKAKQQLKTLIERNHVNIIAIGNGTASRESEILIAELLKQLQSPVSYMVISEAGASVYSASKLAAEEFPDYDVSLRSAVSIARRLQDPLAELVKIDPKAIGVGQYQHDMPKNQLDEALGGVVEDCVNRVGVDLNTASQSLLSYIAGINTAVAKNIVCYREENGAFQNRKELLQVNKLGKKAFTQCAGFLRVSDSDNILDNTGVHPESYSATKLLLKECGYSLEDVKTGQIGKLEQKIDELGMTSLAEKLNIGVPTLQDIVKELLKPGRDPRDELPKPLLRTDVLQLEDLKPGMQLQGTIRNVIDFGAFVDIGVHEDGLVHISQICKQFIRHPLEVVNVGDIVTVWVLDVDLSRKRIALTMKAPEK